MDQNDITSNGGNAIVAMGDVGDRSQVQAVAQSALDAFGTIDVLINNAAVRPNFNFLEDSEDKWERIFNVNFKSSLWLSRACLPGMKKNGWGRIINFSGMNAQQGYQGKSAVSVSKHAAWGLTKSLAKEYGVHGITSNIISPGTIVGEEKDTSTIEKYASLQKNNPSGRLGTPDDIASTVTFLVSDEASFVNGQLLQINGGVVM